MTNQFCPTHGTELLAGHYSCLECECEALYTDSDGRLDPAHDQFADWLKETTGGKYQTHSRENLLIKLHVDPDAVLRLYRWEWGGTRERLTIAVRVCTYCRGFVGVTEWRGTDAHEHETWTETGSICEGCAARVEQELGEVA